ncbi:N-acetylmuramoyl-L-alanine amidase [cf. Phormidesmis sp. LEGE 11477]|uniref:hormogonium tapered terminus morphoprotein TftA n=1 Tax=cf. Phormidesmis sp. LEGE 11477 TaxID=1828680 RepID=UPI00187EA421|nr:N-acetylmuramoyl-L-alanine amidase [cf. Phormidesmis sp. LEGE 11477]MBE9063317.1 N-acetylmuramoyl-L-alanine amidase [cf. Phormidesmis sp. LEGE 11477]
MAQIFISAGHGGIENGVKDTGARVAGTTEAQEMIALRDLVVPELRSRGYNVLSVPDDLSLARSIDWINARNKAGAIAIEIHAESFANQATRGATVYHIAGNRDRRDQAELILLSLLKEVPELPSRGVLSDASAPTGRLAFCRQTLPPALVAEIAYLTNPQDFALLTQRRRNFAIGLANGLAAWSRAVTGRTPTPTTPEFPPINIEINGGEYDEKGIIVSGNAYIPIDLAELLSVDLSTDEIRRVRYRGVVYIKAVDLKPFSVGIGWDANTRTLQLKPASALKICPGTIDLIMSHGSTTEVTLSNFLRTENKSALETFPDIAELYRQEATTEGVDYDIAFCQMCVETDFLRFPGLVRSVQNNFAGLADGSGNFATFPSARIGVRAHIQHLKAYASTEPLARPQVDPRFDFVKRGSAPLVGQLSNLWEADPLYGDRIIARLNELYQLAGLL